MVSSDVGRVVSFICHHLSNRGKRFVSVNIVLHCILVTFVLSCKISMVFVLCGGRSVCPYVSIFCFWTYDPAKVSIMESSHG